MAAASGGGDWNENKIKKKKKWPLEKKKKDVEKEIHSSFSDSICETWRKDGGKIEGGV